MPDVRFHARVLAETGLAAVFSAADRVHARERDCGFRFPASIVEWYSLEGAIQLLEAHNDGNADRGGQIVPLELLGEPDPSAPDVPFRGYLQLYRNGEADLPIYVILDGSDDPAVYVDASEFDVDDLLIPRLVLYKNTFSEFVYDWITHSRPR